MKEVTLSDIAKSVNLDINVVRDILTEKTGLKLTKTTMDLVFQAARKMGYDFKKLKLGKRMNQRKEVVDDLIKQIELHPKWKRKEIMEYLNNTSSLVERVHKRAFIEEFAKK
jgi:hypothetical protein